jgi:hemoglobin-like flavoprotein
MKLIIAAVVLSMCVAYTTASGCDLLQRFKVKHQWSEAFGSGHHRIEFGVRVFRRLFKSHPETRTLFERVNGENIFSPAFEAHAERVLSGLDVTIGLLDDPAALAAQFAHLKEKHVPRNVKTEYYTYFGTELKEVLSFYLGTKFDYAAWSDCLTALFAKITA